MQGCLPLLCPAGCLSFLSDDVALPSLSFLPRVWAGALIGFFAALIGRMLALRIVQKLSHPSIIAYVLAGVLAAAFSLLLIQMRKQRADWSFESLCE